MPNWCSTDIKIIIDNKKDGVEFYNKLKDWTSHSYIKNDFDNSKSGAFYGWLGNVVGHADIDPTNDVNFSKYRCRGEITFLDAFIGHNEVEITIDTETAWEPMLQMWQAVAEKHIGYHENGIPKFSIFYTASEPGCELFWTNDPDIAGTWTYEDEDDTTYELSESDVKRRLKERYAADLEEHDTNDCSLDALLEMTYDDDNCWLYKYKLVEINDCL